MTSENSNNGEMKIKTLLFDLDSIKLLRVPFSFFLIPVFFFALSQASEVNWTNASLCFFILYSFIYQASNRGSSSMDQEEKSIGGLEHPPKPQKKLFYTSILIDLIGLRLSLFINIQFFIGVTCYIIASRASSVKDIRFKKFPIIGPFTVIFFQSALMFWMVYSVVRSTPIVIDNTPIFALIGCSFLIGGIYPLNQVYQHDTDSSNGDFILSYKLGISGTFMFSTIMFILTIFLFYFYFDSIHKISHFIYFQLFLLSVVIYFLNWFYKATKDKSQASFRNMMNMNFSAAKAMNSCFVLPLILNYNR